MAAKAWGQPEREFHQEEQLSFCVCGNSQVSDRLGLLNNINSNNSANINNENIYGSLE